MSSSKIHEQTSKEIYNTGIPRIIVIGASSGGFEALKKIVKNLPPDFSIPIFIVWHMSAGVHGILPQVLNRENNILAAHAYDKEPILPNRIYVAPPDYHMILDKGMVRVTHGPKENRFRPAVDPLFRSAAYRFGNRVIGVILSGALDDGTTGLWTVKKYGGVAIVQDPNDAEIPSMPEHALQAVEVDHCVPVNEMSALLTRLSKEPVNTIEVMKDEITKKEIDIAVEKNLNEKEVFQFGELTPYSCPECHGVLSRLHNDKIIRYRCHTGHAYSADTLMISITEKIEDNLYSAMRGMDEIVILLNHIGDHYAEENQPRLASDYFKKAKEAIDRTQLIRNVVLEHEQLSKEKMEHASAKKEMEKN